MRRPQVAHGFPGSASVTRRPFAHPAIDARGRRVGIRARRCECRAVRGRSNRTRLQRASSGAPPKSLGPQPSSVLACRGCWFAPGGPKNDDGPGIPGRRNSRACLRAHFSRLDIYLSTGAVGRSPPRTPPRYLSSRARCDCAHFLFHFFNHFTRTRCGISCRRLRD